MLRKVIGTVALMATMAGTAAAQGRGRGPSDHWMTLDSLVTAVGATDSQKAGIKMHLDALNGIYKTRMEAYAAARNGGARPDSAATAKWQADAMAHYEEIGKLLNAAEKTKFDALPKPRLMGGGRRMGGGN